MTSMDVDPTTTPSLALTPVFPAENNEEPISEEQPNKRRRKKSIVWEHFTIETVGAGCMRACCKQCKKSFAYITGSKLAGTSHLKRHIALGICPVSRQKNEALLQSTPGAKTDPPKRRYRTTPVFGGVPFDQDCCNQEVAKMIIQHDYPLNIVEHPAFVDFVRTLQPQYNMASFDTIQGECLQLYHREKQNLLDIINGMPGRLSLVLDLATSNFNLGYAFLTGHFIDDDWNLNRRILNVAMLPFPDSDDAFNNAVVSCISEWNLGNRLFTLTLDQSFANETMVGNLRGLLSTRNPHKFNGQLLKGSCYARVLSRLAQDALGAMADVIKRIRESVKYVKTSESHDDKFAELRQRLQVPSNKELIIDDRSKWNSTYEMLVAACELKEVFACLDTTDPVYKINPSMDDWKQVEVLCTYLKLFYEAASILTGPTYPPANAFYHEVSKVQLELTHAAMSQDPFVSNLTRPLKEKFDQYWKECFLVLAIAVVMDPRFKMKLVEFSFQRIFNEDAGMWIKIVDDGIHELFLDYLPHNISMPTSYMEAEHANISHSEIFQELHPQQVASQEAHFREAHLQVGNPTPESHQETNSEGATIGEVQHEGEIHQVHLKEEALHDASSQVLHHEVAQQEMHLQEVMVGHDVSGEVMHVEEVHAQEMHIGEASAQEMHTGEVPAQEMHTGEVPAQEMHTGEVPVQEVCAEEAPLQEVQMGENPVQEVQMGEAPVQEVQMGEVPLQEMQREEAPVQEMQFQEQPVQEMHAGEAPVKEMHADEMPAQEFHADMVQGQEMCAVEVPAQEICADKKPVQEMLADEVPAQEMHAEEVPVQEMHSQELPVEVAKSQEVPQQEMDDQEVLKQATDVQEVSPSEMQTHEESKQEIQTQESTYESQPVVTQEIQASEEPTEEKQAFGDPTQEILAQEEPIQEMHAQEEPTQEMHALEESSGTMQFKEVPLKELHVQEAPTEGGMHVHEVQNEETRVEEVSAEEIHPLEVPPEKMHSQAQDEEMIPQEGQDGEMGGQVVDMHPQGGQIEDMQPQGQTEEVHSQEENGKMHLQGQNEEQHENILPQEQIAVMHSQGQTEDMQHQEMYPSEQTQDVHTVEAQTQVMFPPEAENQVTRPPEPENQMMHTNEGQKEEMHHVEVKAEKVDPRGAQVLSVQSQEFQDMHHQGQMYEVNHHELPSQELHTQDVQYHETHEIPSQEMHAQHMEYHQSFSEEMQAHGVNTQDLPLLTIGDGLSDFEVYISEISNSQHLKSELDQYLEESLLPRVQDFDVLGWWKLNKLKYPILSKMAADILSIPLSTVAPDSVFDAKIKKIDNYRSSLRPVTLEALVCTKDWLQHGSSGQPYETSNALVKMDI